MVLRMEDIILRRFHQRHLEKEFCPLKEGDDSIALKEAVMTPSILSEFYNQFDNNKLPKADIAYNILTSKGVPKDKVEATWDILKNNAKKAQILKIIGGNEYIFINKSVEISTTPEIEVEVEDLGTTDTEETIPADVLKKMNIVAPNPTMVQAPIKKSKPNIFISHGQNNATIVGQLKELLVYGQMEPVVSIEREATTAIPVSR